MYAVPSTTGFPAAGADQPMVPAPRRRAVAVAVSPMELLRPESELVRLLRGVPQVDLLVATDDLPVVASGPLGVLGGAGEAHLRNDDEVDPEDLELDDVESLAGELAALGLEDVHVHRLGLSAPLDLLAEADLIAALSELVGFDPEPGVYCLAPGPAAADPSRTVIDSAAQRIARVYGLPLVRYRCLELCIVGAP